MSIIKKIIFAFFLLPYFLIMIIAGFFIRFLQMIGIVKVKTWPDDIDNRKSMANLFVLQRGSYEVAESYSRFDEEQKELLKFATESIKKIDPLGGIPLGFSYEFVAAYPDVVLWWNGLADEEQDSLFKNFDEKNILDKNKKIKQEYLRVIIDTYKKSGGKLECSY